MPTDDLIIQTLRGGYNDEDPASALADDECTIADNVEQFFSTIAERRSGCVALDITGSGLSAEAKIVMLAQWFPQNTALIPEFWALGGTPGASATLARRTTSGTWQTITPTDAFNTSVPDLYDVQTQALNGSLFFAYHSGVDRLHLFDGTNFRRAGLTQPPAAPSAVDEGADTFTGVRYYRIRYVIENSAGTVLVRSEPSAVLTFTPSGAGMGATVTRPALINENETHWELEASEDNANFYRITTQPIATTTFNDEVVFATGYAATGTLSETIGEYLTLPSAKYLTADGDRLIFAGHWTDPARQATVGWTLAAGSPGAGNDERLPQSITDTLVLDNYAGGEITGVSKPDNGTWYAFKWERIYKLVRTGDPTQAYDAILLSTSRGAIRGSIISGIDEAGRACTYYLDPMHGPSRIGSFGPQTIHGLRGTWASVNLRATDVIARGVYYPYKQQVWWWITTGTSNTPNRVIKLQVPYMRSTAVGAKGSWMNANGTIATATAAAIFNEWVVENGNNTLSERPFVGLATPNFIQRCDTGTTDAGTAYIAKIRTRPFFRNGLLNRWGAMVGALLADALSSGRVQVSFIRDYGYDTTEVKTDLAAELSETSVIKVLDGLAMSEAKAIQIEFRDPDPEADA